MIKLNLIQKLIIKDLANSVQGLELFTLYRRYNILPSVIVSNINKLVRRKLIERKNDIYVLTRKAKKYFLAKPEAIAIYDKPWRKVPEEYKAPQLGIYSPYIPRISKLDKSFKLSKNKRRKGG